jgi:hypothetical protein
MALYEKNRAYTREGRYSISQTLGRVTDIIEKQLKEPEHGIWRVRSKMPKDTPKR